MPAPLLHIGYHKTGTTWLQRRLFGTPALGFAAFRKHDDVHARLVRPHALDFDAGACRDYFDPRIADVEGRSLVAVVSSERLSGNPHSGGYDTKELADRLATVFPHGRVLIVFREQRAMIGSTYKQYVKAGGRASLLDYLHPPERGASRLPLFDFAYFEYHRLVGYYRERFGPDRVLALPYEMFRARPLDYVSRIVEFAGLGVSVEALRRLPFSERDNRALSGLAAEIRRRVNPIVLRDRLGGAPLIRLTEAAAIRVLRACDGVADRVAPGALAERLDRRLADTVRREVGTRYAQSNALTAELTGVELSTYGYELTLPPRAAS